MLWSMSFDEDEQLVNEIVFYRNRTCDSYSIHVHMLDIVDINVLWEISYKSCEGKYSKIYLNIRVVIVNYLFIWSICNIFQWEAILWL